MSALEKATAFLDVATQATDSIFKRKRKSRARKTKRGRRAGAKVQARRRRACEQQQQIVPSSSILAEVLAQALQSASLLHEAKHNEPELINLATSNDNDAETVIISPRILPTETIM